MEIDQKLPDAHPQRYTLLRGLDAEKRSLRTDVRGYRVRQLCNGPFELGFFRLIEKTTFLVEPPGARNAGPVLILLWCEFSACAAVT